MKKSVYFSNCKTLQELKTKYRELVFTYHPDIAGDASTETMKQINNEYESMFEYIKSNPVNEQEKKSNYYANVNDGFREVLSKIVHLPEIEIEICGSWLWVTGETKNVKDQLKEAGLFWAAKKQAWYFKPVDYKAKKKIILGTWTKLETHMEANQLKSKSELK